MEWLGILQFLPGFYISSATSEYLFGIFIVALYILVLHTVFRAVLWSCFTKTEKKILKCGKGSRQTYFIQQNFIKTEVAGDVHKLTERK